MDDRLEDMSDADQLAAQITCRAALWRGAHPVYAGDHAQHSFTYGEGDRHIGICIGWPRPPKEVKP